MVHGRAVTSSALRSCRPVTAPSAVNRASATKPSITRIDGVLRTASVSAEMMALRHVAADMHDAARRMCGLAADRKLAFEVAIEGHAVLQEVVNARGRFLCQRQCDAFVDDAAADRDGIGRMRLGAVAFGDCRCDAALRPGAGGALAEGCGGNQRDRTRRELQRAEQSG